MPNQRLLHVIGKNIVNERKKRGFSQKILASKVNLTYESLSRIERGITAPSIIRLHDIAQALGCSLNLLLQSESATIHEKACSIAEALDVLNEAQQDAVLKMMYANIDVLRPKG